MFTYPKFSCEGGFGLYSCSGALVNNYYDDFTPYFLTAEHCGTCTIDLERAVFYFNRQSPECYNANGVDDYRVSGARDLSSCSGPDVRLIQINKPIPLQYNVYFSGWDTRARNDMPSHTVVGIHHPQSDLKKISKGRWYNNWYNYTFRNNFWEVCWFDGIMEPGSSGAPIFEEQTKRIIGVHSNGSRGLNCNDEGDFCKWIGKLRYCWHDGGIQKYLGKGIATVNLDGADPVRACLSNINMFGYFGDAREYRAVKHQIRIQGKDRINIGNPIEYTEFKSNANFIITARDEINITDNTGDYHFDEIFTWNQYNYNDVELEMYTAPCQYTEEECGFNYFKMASAGKISNLVELEKESTEIIIHPNPTTQNSTLTIIGYQDKKVEILVLDQSGKTIFSKTMSKVESKEATIDIESRYWAKGIYIVRVTNNQDTKALKLVKE
jgi:V8-like Glu-specific endopeptidase